jgi:hypothetical protein
MSSRSINEGECSKLALVDTWTDKVLTVIDYFDGPVSGIANYKGQPHFYDLIFSMETDDYDRREDGFGLFCLRPVDEPTLRLALEDWEIWKRWHRAFAGGKTSSETHPALPEDRRRHSEIKAILDAQLQTECVGRFETRGKFNICKRSETSGLQPNAEWEVEWRPT